ncbi:branched-chain amino acid transport system II carrier protein [Bacillus xiapuensis]|uniref:branched-chain amino acid transport system II carrier protein n=1 Tax=Bacillus xiapuensis TaxID=2014075 RepID=UPI000C243D43|nr:branched-chain amino acid transport system II carrier protein [Bacillus xiapuensis]
MKKFDTLFIGLMLFSMFFGAGNLIFPPHLGAQSGTSYWLAMAGFIVTSVGLPFAVLLAVSLVKDGAPAIANRVHPVFSAVFMFGVYLSIGPFLGIPRNANVAYEMGVKPFLPEAWNPSLMLFLYTFVFFALVYIISLDPSKMEKYLSRWITPVLLVAMVVLCAIGFAKLDAPLQTPAEGYQSGALFKGFIEGYNTMDALAALAYGIVILTSIRQKGISDRKALTKYTWKAAIIAGFLLSLVYISLGVIGGRMAANGSFADGTDILSAASIQLLGQNGTILLGLIFTLACFTTVVGLTTSCSQYFAKLFPKAGYKTQVFVLTLVGFTLANMGLAQILKVSVPFLVTAYPLTIVLIALTFFHRYFKHAKKVYGCTVLCTGVFAVLGGLHTAGVHLGPLQTVREHLPLSAYGLEWAVPALAGAALGLLWSQFDKKLVPEQKLDATS